MTKIIDFSDPTKVIETESPMQTLPEPPGKANMIEWLENLLSEVRANKVEGVFCCWTYTDEPEVSSGIRVGLQGMTLLGRVSHLTHRMMNDLDIQQ